MDKREKALRDTLYAKGYTLIKKEIGYQIGDQVANAVYLGGKFDATLEKIATFVDNMDDTGFSSMNSYAEKVGMVCQ